MLLYKSIIPGLLLFLCTQTSIAGQKCPIGFNLANNTEKNNTDQICYREKKPETFYDKFTDCAGNLFTFDLYNRLNIPKSNNTLWTDYKTLYTGRPFIDWSYTESMGNILVNISNLLYMKPRLYIDGEQCVLSDLRVARCSDKHYRYCFVKPLDIDGKANSIGCKDGSYRFYGPRPTCLSMPAYDTTHTITNTWHKAKNFCADKKEKLLSRGWRYASSPLFDIGTSDDVPLGIMLSADNTLHIVDENITISSSEWDYKRKFTRDKPLGALRENSLHMVDSSDKFYKFVCESPILLSPISINVSITSEGVLVLKTNKTVPENEIYCFTDAVSNFTYKIKVVYDQRSGLYVLQPTNDGYYWCLHVDTVYYKVSESNKVLFIRIKDSLLNKYVVKLGLVTGYKRKIYDDYIDKLSQYIYYWTKYVKNNRDEVPTEKNITEKVLKLFKENNPELNWMGEDVILNKTEKGSFYGPPMTLHVLLHPNMKPVLPGTWEYLTVESMKPAYYCPPVGGVNSAPVGSFITVNCETYNCTGDYNKGVQWQILPVDNCYTTERDREEEQLQQVIKEVKDLLNKTGPVMVKDIEPVFNKVDAVLNLPEILETNGTMLVLLDELGMSVDLNGSKQVAIVRNNIALLMTDSNAKQPVRGLRIKSMAHDSAFNKDDFEIISDQVNTTFKNETVVYLPESVANRPRRISFTVFRNSSAFQGTSRISVNSQILSIKVEDITKFNHGEVIDIRFSPLQENLDRNHHLACVYWHFLENTTGFWSQEGCTFVRSTEEGVLGFCRCDHLTHFAQVLIPKDLFSQRNEDALEILTITGCCLSVFGLLMIGITAALFRSWRQDYSNKIWLQLCLAILLLVICFLVVVFAKFDHYSISCLLIGMLLHYSVLASFCWMLVAAVLSYRRLVIVFAIDDSHRLLRASTFSWGVPCVIVGILFSVAPNAYAGLFDEKHPSGGFCYPSGFGLWLTVHAPVALTLLANWLIFSLIVRSMFVSRRIQKHCDQKETLRCAAVSCLLAFLFGLPWIFGLFAYNIFSAYIFVLTATFQGFVLFLFFVLINKKTRDLWFNKLKMKQTGKTPVSLTNTDKSTDDDKKPFLLNEIQPTKKKIDPIKDNMEEVISELQQIYMLTNNEICYHSGNKTTRVLRWSNLISSRWRSWRVYIRIKPTEV